MKFSRKGPKSFVSEDKQFKIVRPSGTKVNRDSLDFRSKEHDYNVRMDESQVWLLDGDREVGWADGSAGTWRLLFGTREFALDQPKAGSPHTALMDGGERVGEISGKGFPLRSIELTVRADLSDEQRAFVAMIVLLGWREGDREMFGQISTPDGGGGGA